ncbi:MAG: hypothetical protein NBV57_00005 [Algoriphagus sp.]|nr:hypothetical protein [Algoriphagus sp.]
MRFTLLSNFSFSKLGLLVILGVGWMEKVFAWEGVPESIYKLVETNVLTSWLTALGPMGPNYFLGYFELLVFILLIFKEKYGSILSCLIFLTTLSFLFNGFSFSLVKDVTMLGISLDLTLKNWIKKPELS